MYFSVMTNTHKDKEAVAFSLSVGERFPFKSSVQIFECKCRYINIS